MSTVHHTSLTRGASFLVFSLALAALGDTCATGGRSANPPPSPEASRPAPASAGAQAPPAASVESAAAGNAGAGGYDSAPSERRDETRAAATAPADREAAAPTFEASVEPILTERCSPCHFPGGVMYGRLPFDQPGTLSEHAAGVRRRLKEKDLETFERWLATLPTSP